MASRSTSANLRHKDGEVTIQQHETDSPLIPVAQLERLHAFKPDAVDWVINQTQAEAEFRRAEHHRVNPFTLIERLVGQVFALVIGLSGILGGGYVALHGQPEAGAFIASVTIGGLAVAFITGRRQSRSKYSFYQFLC